jgi:hypothetical protein
MMVALAHTWPAIARSALLEGHSLLRNARSVDRCCATDPNGLQHPTRRLQERGANC